jgi:pre-mRNA-splicing factor ISY1
MLYRFRAQQAADLGILDISRTKRPKVITSIESIPVCEKWRGQVLKEISRKVTKIQDPSLSDYQVRDLNDEINKLMREKHVWELRIRELGGPNYMRGGKVLDEDGKEVPGGGKGYRYFGRAKELPGVKELFEAAKEAAKPQEEDKGPTRVELLKHVDAAYYGYNLDEEDGALLAYESKRELEAYKALSQQAQGQVGSDEDWEDIPGDTGDGVGWSLPTLDQVQEELVDRRRRRLLDKLG